MKRNVFLAALATVAILPTTALAQSENDLGIYAAFAKLEANIGEMSGKIAFYVLSVGEGNYAKEYSEDVSAVYGYLRALERLELGEEQQAQVSAFREQWGPVEDEGEEIIAAVDSGGTADELLDRLNTWYGSIDELDEFTDDNLEAILEANNVTLDTARDDQGGGGSGGSGQDDNEDGD